MCKACYVKLEYMKTFRDRVHKVVKGIPSGSVMTYKEVAKKAGSPNAFRAVGNIMAKNKSKEIPCHRVIRSDGKLGGYGMGGIRKKKQILISEGVKI